MSMENTLARRRKLILRCLQESADLSMGEITHKTALHHYAVKDMLQDLEKEGQIIRFNTTRGERWKLKK